MYNQQVERTSFKKAILFAFLDLLFFIVIHFIN